jgi:hypothetical protein
MRHSSNGDAVLPAGPDHLFDEIRLAEQQEEVSAIFSTKRPKSSLRKMTGSSRMVVSVSVADVPVDGWTAVASAKNALNHD